ncbi:MAG: response regulator [Halopenitus sp.]
MIDRRNGDPVDILLVEDNPGDVRLTQEAFQEASLANGLAVTRDGEEALDYLFQRGEYEDAPVPSLILLDLNLPKVGGMDVLETIKAEPDLRRIPVVVLTGSDAEEDVVESYENYVNAYLTKPIDPDEFVDLVRSFENFWFQLVELPPAANQ